MAARRYVYATAVRWEGELRAACSAGGKPDVQVGSPPEFGGPDGTWSAEELLVASVGSCLMATFLYYARRSGVELIRYRSEAEGVVELEGRRLAFTSFTVRPSVTVAAGHLAAAQEAMERARACLVSNSLTAAVRVESEVAEAAV